jgi:hypothetical protein
MNVLITRSLKQTFSTEDYLPAVDLICEWDAKLKSLLDDDMVLAAISIAKGDLAEFRLCMTSGRATLIKKTTSMANDGEQKDAHYRVPRKKERVTRSLISTFDTIRRENESDISNDHANGDRDTLGSCSSQ